MRAFAHEPPKVAEPRPTRSRANGAGPSGRSALQGTVGNQGLQRLLQTRAIQAKLTVSEPDDPFEEEADRVAEQVMRMTAPGASAPDRPCAVCAASATTCPACAAKHGAIVQRRTRDDARTQHRTTPPGFGMGLDLGRPLDPAARAFFEPRFQRDFGEVRVHTGAEADRSAESIGATAYTMGRHIVFRAGRYDPAGRGGRTLLAHELTHVLQQRPPARALPQVQRDDDEPKPEPKPKPKPETKPKPGGKKEEPKPTWSRKHTDGPRLLDGSKASYQVFFDHVMPPVPTGKKQVWQVVQQNQTRLDDKCSVDDKPGFIVDIVDIGSRTKINDNWGLIAAGDPCFLVETNTATIGFDDGASGYSQQTSVKVSEKLAKEVLGKMTGPIGTYSGVYTFVKRSNCPECKDKLKELQDKQKAPNGEALSVDGVGSWTS